MRHHVSFLVLLSLLTLEKVNWLYCWANWFAEVFFLSCTLSLQTNYRCLIGWHCRFLFELFFPKCVVVVVVNFVLYVSWRLWCAWGCCRWTNSCSSWVEFCLSSFRKFFDTLVQRTCWFMQSGLCILHFFIWHLLCMMSCSHQVISVCRLWVDEAIASRALIVIRCRLDGPTAANENDPAE